MAYLRAVHSRPPAAVTVLGLVALAVIAVPLLALLTRVPWTELPGILTTPETTQLLSLTLSAAVLSSVVTMLLGVPFALWLQSLRRGAQVARLLVLLPLAMPPVVSGLALSAAIGNRGLLNPVLEALGIQFAFQFAGVVAAHVFVSLPFVVVTVDSALRQMDREVTSSAAGIGLTPMRVLRQITLPTIAPSIATGTGLAFARSLGEFGTTITFAGSLPGVTRTMSIAIYLEREVDRDTAYALSAVLILLAVVVLAVASLPALLRRTPEPVARDIGPMDTERLRELTAPAAGLSVQVTSNGVSTEFPPEKITAVIGPNGSGKSTLMGLIAGRLRGAEVSVGVGGRGVDKLRPHLRGVVLLTQHPGLPRITDVAGAVTMATRDAARTRRLLEAAGLASLHDVPVPALSGGQAAQVALVRALATRPAVLILDEPLAAVDVSSGARWRRLLRAAAADRTTLLVTHDPLDVAGLSDHLVTLESGRVTASGATGEVLTAPPNDFVAEIAGLNRLTGAVTAIEAASVEVRSDDLTIIGTLIDGASTPVDLGDAAIVTIPPEATVLRLPGAMVSGESARNVWPGTVEAVHATDVVTATVDVAVGDGARLAVPVTAAAVAELGLEPGVAVDCVTKAMSVRVHPR